MANSKRNRYPNSFKHEVCQYYTHHTGLETQAKYGVDRTTVSKWRMALGYNNKHRSYNPYTEGMQPALKKREQMDFIMMKTELTDLKARLKDEKLDSAWLKNKLYKEAETQARDADRLRQMADAIKTMEV